MKNVQNPIYLYLWNLYILAKIIALSFFYIDMRILKKPTIKG